MTTETQGQLPRRSFLATAIAVAAGSMLAGGTVVAGAGRASAADGADVTWRITSEAADARTGYANMIRGINQAISSHRVRPSDGNGDPTGRPVYVTDSEGRNSYITVDLHAEDRPAMIRVFMRRSDTYVMGWRSGTENADGSVAWRTFYHLESDITLPGARRPVRDSTGREIAGNTNSRWEGLANYSDLAQQGATRDGMEITPASLHASVMNLWDSGEFIRAPVGARSILQIIVALAEASRFRNQAAATAVAFGQGQPYIVTAQHMAQHNNWSLMSAALLGAVLVASAALSPELEIGGAVYETAAALAGVLMMAHHSDKNSRGRGFLAETTLLVAADGTGDYWTVQDAINAIPNSGDNTIVIDTGVYHEVISVPKGKSWLTIESVSGKRGDVIIHNSRCNGMINPSTGAKYGTQGSAVATFRPPNLTVRNLTISNTFNRAAHPEISPYETQAVAVAAMGDRQVFRNVSIMSHQDTLLVKGETPTTQARQYFVGCFIRGDVDFIFGNATAVIDRSSIQALPWPGGTVLAPNTDYRKKYGILIIRSRITTAGVPNDTMHLGRPWKNAPEVSPQAVVRQTEIAAGIKDAQPWTNMVPDYPWQSARFKEYWNWGDGTGFGPNSPQMSDSEAASYTAEKYLAGTDGWDPV
ncbi:pectinesterase family protein [Streptomyces europaeiscabiei]|uniref:pectinesterase family protein n=1 Tax=Streptomyces europaeiscabiei TaxID=146819 RepID=UPI0029A6F08C|nr:pectinesterase family protein [Streptomyces europaeiscabiei]MDX3629139.1 pectinesterase family protein [Streptomyces europaeiscabiei]MDX3647243.1 pectinesterase family protein [Streptomyces europaeiscabiei]WUD36051.1 pectinesterase family protein [Streptomyces europaeiscabiei]